MEPLGRHDLERPVDPFGHLVGCLNGGIVGQVEDADDDRLVGDGSQHAWVELRLGAHFGITADARFEARKRANDVAPAVASTYSVDGKPVHALDDQVGGQFRLGAALYF